MALSNADWDVNLFNRTASLLASDQERQLSQIEREGEVGIAREREREGGGGGGGEGRRERGEGREREFELDKFSTQG